MHGLIIRDDLFMLGSPALVSSDTLPAMTDGVLDTSTETREHASTVSVLEAIETSTGVRSRHIEFIIAGLTVITTDALFTMSNNRSGTWTDTGF
jgi:hypothetical protein